jgi:hypothetical protein
MSELDSFRKQLKTFRNFYQESYDFRTKEAAKRFIDCDKVLQNTKASEAERLRALVVESTDMDILERMLADIIIMDMMDTFVLNLQIYQASMGNVIKELQESGHLQREKLEGVQKATEAFKEIDKMREALIALYDQMKKNEEERKKRLLYSI